MKKFKYLLKFQKKIRKDLMVTFGLIIISALLTVIPPYVSKLILDEGVYGGQMMLIIKFSLIYYTYLHSVPISCNFDPITI